MPIRPASARSVPESASTVANTNSDLIFVVTSQARSWAKSGTTQNINEPSIVQLRYQ